MKVAGDFTAQVHVKGNCQNLYDQAGMMVRIDDQIWLKSRIEVSDGEVMLGSVLTYGHSDWATGIWDDKGTGLWLRVTPSNSVIRIQSSTDGVRWPPAPLGGIS
jgi:regulation of enolase protein 1 (concanavalin A-like superfamily)